MNFSLFGMRFIVCKARPAIKGQSIGCVVELAKKLSVKIREEYENIIFENRALRKQNDLLKERVETLRIVIKDIAPEVKP